MSGTAEQYAWTHLEGEQCEAARTGTAVQRDQVVYDFRGEPWIFKGVSRLAYGNSSGRVSVYRTCPDARTDARTGIQACPHAWHRNGIETAEYFPHVFGLYLGDAQGNEA